MHCKVTLLHYWYAGDHIFVDIFDYCIARIKGICSRSNSSIGVIARHYMRVHQVRPHVWWSESAGGQDDGGIVGGQDGVGITGGNDSSSIAVAGEIAGEFKFLYLDILVRWLDIRSYNQYSLACPLHDQLFISFYTEHSSSTCGLWLVQKPSVPALEHYICQLDMPKRLPRRPNTHLFASMANGKRHFLDLGGLWCFTTLWLIRWLFKPPGWFLEQSSSVQKVGSLTIPILNDREFPRFAVPLTTL